MISFAKFKIGWFNKDVKNSSVSVNNKPVSRYLETDTHNSTDINVLLNRVKVNQKNESRKKIYFSAAASAGLILFGIAIF